MVNLVTVKDRELMKVGRWPVHQGGEFNVTPELIAAALKGHEAGVLRKPTIRLGHNDPRFTGDPAVGWVDNVHASADGQTLYGDLVGVPDWLANNLPSAYPSLSIEGVYDYTAPDGTNHDFLLTGLALLGATLPGIGSLKSVQDVEALFGGEKADIAAAIGEIGGTAVQFVQIEAASAAPEKGEPAMASLNETLAQRLGLEPDAAEEAIVAALDAKLTPADEKKDEPKADEPKADPAPEPVAQAAPEAVAAAAPSTVQLQKDQYDVLMDAAAEVHKIRAEQATENREKLVMAAIGDGRITRASKPDWLKALETDPGGHNAASLAALAPGFVPVSEIGHSQVSASGAEPSTTDRGPDAFVQYAHNKVMASLGIPTPKGNN